MVDKLGLKTTKHPYKYKLQCLNDGGELKVMRHVVVPFSIGKYKDELDKAITSSASSFKLNSALVSSTLAQAAQLRLISTGVTESVLRQLDAVLHEGREYAYNLPRSVTFKETSFQQVTSYHMLSTFLQVLIACAFEVFFNISSSSSCEGDRLHTPACLDHSGNDCPNKSYFQEKILRDMLSEFMSSNDIETNDLKHGEDVTCESFAEDIFVEDKIPPTPQSFNEIQNCCEDDVRNVLPCDQEKELLKLFDASNKDQINACIGGLKRCILDKKLKLFVKSEKDKPRAKQHDTSGSTYRGKPSLTKPRSSFNFCEERVDFMFDFYGYPEEHQVSLVTLIFKNYAAIWWQNICRNGETKIRTWAELKKVMREIFAPIHYLRNIRHMREKRDHDAREGKEKVEIVSTDEHEVSKRHVTSPSFVLPKDDKENFNPKEQGEDVTLPSEEDKVDDHPKENTFKDALHSKGTSDSLHISSTSSKQEESDIETLSQEDNFVDLSCEVVSPIIAFLAPLPKESKCDSNHSFNSCSTFMLETPSPFKQLYFANIFFKRDMGSDLQKTENKEAESEKSLINGPNLDFVEPLRGAQINHSTYDKEAFSIHVVDRSLTFGLDSRANPFEEWGNDTCTRRVKLHILEKKLKLFDASNKAQINARIGGLKRCILDKKLKLFAKSRKSSKLRRLFGWDPGIFGMICLLKTCPAVNYLSNAS
ncbi:hypothetical protein V6N13_114010 [Hibiscus sabdariffa]